LDEIPLILLFLVLAFLIVLSGFFSGSETALISLNRILLGNNFVNILASSIATIIALRLMGEAGIAVATGLLTLVILIFAEVTPKTLAALHPERFAFPATYCSTPWSGPSA